MLRRVLVGAALLVSLCGCMEEDMTVDLRADGQGTLRFERIYGAQMSEMASMGGDDSVRSFVAQQLDGVEGVVAWTDVEYEILDDGRVRMAATGWFEDVTAINREEGDDNLVLTLVEEGSTCTLEFGMPFMDEDKGSYFDEDPEELAQQRAMVRGQLTAMLADFRQTLTLNLPGPVSECSGFEADGQQVRVTVDVEKVVTMIEGLFDAGEALRPQVESGELDQEDADAMLREQAAELGCFGVVSYTPGTAGATGFDAELAAAVAAWESSEWFALAQDGGGMGFGGGLVETPSSSEPAPDDLEAGGPDAFEPNNAFADASGLEAGEYKNLQLDGEDWYAIKLAASQRLTVSLAFDGEACDIDTSLNRGEYDQVQSSMGLGNREEMTYISGEAETLYVRVWGGEAPYHLTVTCEDYEAADAFEPNDGRESAAALGVGTHSDLVRENDDWYRVEVPAGQQLRVVANFSHAGGDIDISLQDDEWSTLDSSYGTGDSEEVSYVAVNGGSVLLRVHGGEGNSYSLTVTCEEYVPGDAFEPNNDTESAAALGVGTHEGLAREGDDWYRIEVPAEQQLRVVARFAHANGDIELSLQSERWDTLDSSFSSSNEETVEFATRTGAAVLLRVHGGEGNTYSLEVSCEAYTPADAYEPNNLRNDAQALGQGTHEGLVRQGDDWYALEVPAGQTLTVTANFAHSEGDIDLALQTENSMQAASSAGVEDSETLSYGKGVAETVYLRVYGGEGSSYSLEIGCGEWTAADPYEPNEDQESAAAIGAGSYEGLVCGSSDWYSIELKAGQTLTVSLSFTHAEGDIDLEVQGTEGWGVGSSTGVDDSESVTVTAEEDGTYFVHVYMFGNENSYDMTITCE